MRTKITSYESKTRQDQLSKCHNQWIRWIFCSAKFRIGLFSRRHFYFLWPWTNFSLVVLILLPLNNFPCLSSTLKFASLRKQLQDSRANKLFIQRVCKAVMTNQRTCSQYRDLGIHAIPCLSLGPGTRTGQDVFWEMFHFIPTFVWALKKNKKSPENVAADETTCLKCARLIASMVEIRLTTWWQVIRRVQCCQIPAPSSHAFSLSS